MASMSTEIAVLRALLRLSRRSAPTTLADLLERVGGDASDLQRALASLARSQLVLRSGESARLSLSGLAVAVAVTANARRAKTVARPSRPMAMARRRHAA
jgi:DNA-binding IclR family transcriptional regulator